MHAPCRARSRRSSSRRSVLVVMAACTLGGTFTPYYLPDTAPSALDVAVQMYVGGNTPSIYSTVVDVTFSVPGHVVSFREGETLACNGAAPVLLSSQPNGAVNQVPHGDLGGGDTLVCTYTSKGRSTTFTVAIPHPPEILTPAEGDLLPREHALPVTYQGVTGNATLDAHDDLGHGTDVTITNPDHMTIDTSTFAPRTGGLGDLRATDGLRGRGGQLPLVHRGMYRLDTNQCGLEVNALAHHARAMSLGKREAVSKRHHAYTRR